MEVVRTIKWPLLLITIISLSPSLSMSLEAKEIEDITFNILRVVLFFWADHVKSLLELCRVAKEIRVYPLVALNGELSPHLKPAISELEELGHTTELVEVPYQFQKSATQMLVVNTCLKSGNPMVTPLVR